MRRILDKDGRSMRKPLGFRDQPQVPETSEETGVISYTQPNLRGSDQWHGEGGTYRKEPHGT